MPAKSKKAAAEATTTTEAPDLNALRDEILSENGTGHAPADALPTDTEAPEGDDPLADGEDLMEKAAAEPEPGGEIAIAKESPIQITKREYRRLPVTLKPEEISERGRRHGTMQQEYIRIEEEKKEALKDYTAQLKALRAEIDAISEVTSTGIEYQSVECDAVFDRQGGMVVIYRRDTGVEVDRRRMGPAEMQLTTEDYGLEHGIDDAAKEFAAAPEPEEELSPSQRRGLRIAELRERLLAETITDEESEELRALEEWPDEDAQEPEYAPPTGEEIAADHAEVDATADNPLLAPDAPQTALYADGGDNSGAAYDAKMARLKELRNKESDNAFDGKAFSDEERRELDALEEWYIESGARQAVDKKKG